MNEKVKWYQCKRDFIITVLILLLFAIGILGFEVYENFRNNIWVALRIKTGFSPNMVIDLFFQWGAWLPTLGVLITSVIICLKHYWSWLIIVLIGISSFMTIDSSNNLEGTLQLVQILRNEFGDMRSIISFLSNCSTYIIFSGLYAAVVAIIVFAIRKKNEINKEVHNDYK